MQTLCSEGRPCQGRGGVESWFPSGPLATGASLGPGSLVRKGGCPGHCLEKAGRPPDFRVPLLLLLDTRHIPPVLALSTEHPHPKSVWLSGCEGEDALYPHGDPKGERPSSLSHPSSQGTSQKAGLPRGHRLSLLPTKEVPGGHPRRAPQSSLQAGIATGMQRAAFWGLRALHSGHGWWEA